MVSQVQDMHDQAFPEISHDDAILPLLREIRDALATHDERG